ncbi:MAG: ORF6N domain-containing protein [Fibromonadales bacterium]|nr:ORF6N domain-containing protein [Fibromonadales bacterium]
MFAKLTFLNFSSDFTSFFPSKVMETKNMEVFMNNVIQSDRVESLIIIIRGERVLLDSDVATLYGVETKEINQAVRNNVDKFPDGYIFSLDLEEWQNLKSKILTSSWGGKNKLPKAFSEKGLYMLAKIV